VELPAWQQADEESRAVYMFAVLAHDFGKPATTRQATVGGIERIVSPGHDVEGMPLAERFLHSILTPHAVIERVLPLVRYHMAHLQTMNERAVRRLARRLAPETIDGLSIVITADASGRPPKPRGAPAELLHLRRIARDLALQDRAPEPILKGRHLMDAGLNPGKAMGQILEEAFEAQLEGRFNDLPGARQWLERRLGRDPTGPANPA
jgi:tRNA nucleotidyltransferase (CCA-adding enzyme)